MNGNQMASQVPFDPRHYIMGRIALPPSVAAKKSKPFFFTGSTGVIANNGTGTVTIQIHDDSYFLVEGIQMLSSLFTVLADGITVQITDNSQSQSWSNIPVPLRDVGGLGVNVKYLNDPNVLRPTSSITFEFVNNSGSSVNIYVVLLGRKIYGLSKDEVDLMTRRLWYQYVLTFPSLAASAVNSQQNLQIFSESDFLLKKLLSQQIQNAIMALSGGAVDNEILIQIRDTVNDTYLFSDFLPARAIFGAYQSAVTSVANSWSNGNPFSLKKPWLIRRNGQIQISLTNDSTTAISSAFNLVFEGIRIFDAR